MNNVSFLEGLSLAWMLAKRDLKNRYAGSYAGMAWNIGVPLLYALVNVVVFSILVRGRMGEGYANVPFSLFYFVPFSLWIFFSETVNRSTGILREYSYLVNKISFPFWVLPLVPMASALLSQAVIIAITLMLMAYHGMALTTHAWGFLFVWLMCVIFTIGTAYMVSALAVYIPDLSQAVPVAVNIMFWMTPILYPVALVQEHGGPVAKALLMDFNPFFYWAEFSRSAIFGAESAITLLGAGILLLLSIIVAIIGALIFKKLKSGFADVL
ncbi:MAG TPA: ABC transporter permease [Bordetella sp.]